jgi:hypothetical protein
MLKHMRLAVVLLVSGLLPGPLAGQATQAAGEVLQTSIVLSGDETSLELELASGRTLRIRLSDGDVLIDGNEVGHYVPGGLLESAWRELLREAGQGELALAWPDFAGAETATPEAHAAAAIRGAVGPFLAVPAGGATTEARAELASEIADVAAEAAAASATAAALEVAAQELSETTLSELVSGGLVVELSEVEGLARGLRRIGLAPELVRVLNGDLEGPVRIVIDADEYVLPEGAALDHRLILVQSDGVIAGTVAGNVVVAEGSLIIRPTARIEGDVVAVNASVQNQGGTVLGRLRDVSHIRPIVVGRPSIGQRVRIAREAPSPFSRVVGGLGSLAQTVAMYLLFAFLGALVVYFFRGHLEVVSDTVSYSFGRSFLAGLAAEVLFMPIGLVMAVLIITAIAIPFYVVGSVLLALLGYLAVAHAAGENLTQHRFPSWAARMRRSNSYYYVLNGLAVLLALFAVAAITEMVYPLLGWAHDLLIASAWILTWVASTAGLGGALLSRAGTQRKYARPHQIPELPVDTLVEELGPIERRAQARRRAGGESDEA